MHFELERFEYADADDDVLLLVTARAPETAAPSLVVYVLGQVRRLDLESRLVLSDGLLRAQYRLPAELLGSGPPTFWLELDGRGVIDLPAPLPEGTPPTQPAVSSAPTGQLTVTPTLAPQRTAAPTGGSRRAASPGPRRAASPGRAASPLSAPERRSSAQPEPNYQWRLRELMAERGMFSTSVLVAPLASRGVALSTTQVYRLVTGRPERLNLKLLAALCDFLDCSPNDLIELTGPEDRLDADQRP
jgi:DNA-binding Xre family transcriptional regulator